VGWAVPNANPRRLAKWVEGVRALPEVEPEPLLFATLLCGVRLTIVRQGLEEVCERLWSWLTSTPQALEPDLAGLVLEALTPGLKRAIESRGWQFGAEGEDVRKRGHLPGARAAWAAALVVENELRRLGVPPQIAREQVVELAAVLLGRRSAETSDLYARAKGSAVPTSRRWRVRSGNGTKRGSPARVRSSGTRPPRATISPPTKPVVSGTARSPRWWGSTAQARSHNSS